MILLYLSFSLSQKPWINGSRSLGLVKNVAFRNCQIALRQLIWRSLHPIFSQTTQML